SKHGSDSDVYNRKGVFDERAFEEIFSTYADPPNYDTLTPAQIFKLIKGNADPYDFFGWQANFLEWASFYVLLWPEDGRVTKDQLRALYDGSLFPQIAKKVEARRLKAKEVLDEVKLK
ncbi:hypothetical protein FRC01_011422, partial [Tulasnella sp. 417]